MLASLLLRLVLVEDKVNGFRPFPLGFDCCGCSTGRNEEVEEQEVAKNSSGSGSRDWELPRNWDSSDVVEGVL